MQYVVYLLHLLKRLGLALINIIKNGVDKNR